MTPWFPLDVDEKPPAATSSLGGVLGGDSGGVLRKISASGLKRGEGGEREGSGKSEEAMNVDGGWLLAPSARPFS